MVYPELTHTDKMEAARDGLQRILAWLPCLNPAILEAVLVDIVELEAYILNNTAVASPFEEQSTDEINGAC